MESSRALLLTISAQMENPDQAHGSWIQLEPAAIIMAIWGLNLQMENLSVLVSLTDCNSASQIIFLKLSIVLTIFLKYYHRNT